MVVRIGLGNLACMLLLNWDMFCGGHVNNICTIHHQGTSATPPYVEQLYIAIYHYV